MDRANVDDLIIPKQFLKSIKRSGFGPNLFDELRYLDEGKPDADCSQRPLNPDFPSIFRATRGPASCWPGKILAVVQSRARPMGTGRLWYPGGHSPQLCRYFPLQLLQERASADRFVR